MEVDVAEVVDDNVNLAVASAPLAIAVAFIPKATQVYRPAAVVLQLMVFPAPVATEPATTDTAVTSDGT